MIINLVSIIIILAVIYLMMIMPKNSNRSDRSQFMGRFYAHRGLHQGKNIPENSLAAFKLAVDNGYGIEFDVRLTKDKVPVVFHDANLKRVCGVDKMVRDMDYEELREHTLYDSDEKIPHLQEVLDLVDGKVPLIVEIKVSKAFSSENLVCSMINLYLHQYKGVYCIESFNPLIPYWYKKNMPHIIRGQLATKNVYERTKIKNRLLNFTLRNLLYNFFTKPDFIAYNHKYKNLISYNLCRTLYKPLTIAYTIQSQDDLDKNKNKFDIFIFDNFIPQK